MCQLSFLRRQKLHDSRRRVQRNYVEDAKGAVESKISQYFNQVPGIGTERLLSRPRHTVNRVSAGFSHGCPVEGVDRLDDDPGPRPVG
jgi:hypothetical protein